MRNVEAFFFGDNRELFGQFHPGRAPQAKGSILICPPLFHELFGAHYTLRCLGAQLAANGYDVLRFDYFGTGDSRGDLAEGGGPRWTSDVRVAFAELRSISPSSTVSAIALRFGSALALLSRAPFRKIVMWDPVLDGATQLSDLRSTYRSIIDTQRGMPEARRRRLRAHCLEAFEIGRELEDSLEGLSVDLSKRLPAEVVVFGSRGWREGQSASKIASRIGSVDHDSTWTRPGLLMMYPHSLIRAVVHEFR